MVPQSERRLHCARNQIPSAFEVGRSESRRTSARASLVFKGTHRQRGFKVWSHISTVSGDIRIPFARWSGQRKRSSPRTIAVAVNSVMGEQHLSRT